MTHLPDSLMNSLTDTKGFDREAFVNMHLSGEQITSIRLNPLKPVSSFPKFQFPGSRVSWSRYGYYLDQRPSFTFDPLFHAGCYYVQEASSMFLEQALSQTLDLDQSLRILDLSAAPGGKSTHILSLLSPGSLLVSNEVIQSRATVLRDNIIKWGYSNAVVCNNDPKDFARTPGYFDAIVVDAPCSGSGLFRREPELTGEWSLNNVALCSQRQQRILADVWPALKEDGVLVYATCSYSREEDEDIAYWITNTLEAEIINLKIDPTWGIVESGGGYRFWPDKVKGEGFFISCFRKTSPQDVHPARSKNQPESLNKRDQNIVEGWVNRNDLHFINNNGIIYAWPSSLKNDFSFLLNKLRVIYSGTIIGELMRDKLIPHHSLAMSRLLGDEIARSDLDYDNAILYLQRKDLKQEISRKGWQGATYGGQLLGWMNVLPNRVNNYYPRELRILKDS